MTLSKPPISKEYGAWASIATAFLAGSGAAWRVNLESLILFLGALSFFLARMPLLGILRSRPYGNLGHRSFKNRDSSASPQNDKRRCHSEHIHFIQCKLREESNLTGSGFTRYMIWFVLYSLIGIILFSILLFKYRLTALLIFILLSLSVFSYNVYATYSNGPRSNGASFSGILGVSLLSSFTYYAATGYLNSITAMLWFLVFLYLGGGILYVKARLGEGRWKACFIFHIGTIMILCLLGIFKFIPMLSILAYCPSFLKSLMGMLYMDGETIARRLGRMELLHSTIYVILMALIYR